MVDLPLVSVIVPIYNSEEYLDSCLSSLLNQSYKNLEILLIDDGSSDNSRLICQQYTSVDDRFRYFFQSNAGLSMARNLGLSKVTSDFVAFLDSDDYYSESFIERLIFNLLDSKAEVAISNIVVCQKLSQFEKMGPANIVSFDRSAFVKVILSLKGAEQYSVTGGFVCNKLFRRKVIANSLFEKVKGAEDEVFLTRILPKIHRVIYVNDAKYYYLQRTSSLSRRSEFFIYFLKSRYELFKLQEGTEYRDQYLAALFQATIEQLRTSIFSGNQYLLSKLVLSQFKKITYLLFSYIRYNPSFFKYIRSDVIKWSWLFILIFLPSFVMIGSCAFLFRIRVALKRLVG